MKIYLPLLYETSKQSISYHINSILKDGELGPSTIKKILTVQNEGGRLIKRNVGKSTQGYRQNINLLHVKKHYYKLPIDEYVHKLHKLLCLIYQKMSIGKKMPELD